jgi:methyl-accepting chemotaxis protein
VFRSFPITAKVPCRPLYLSDNPVDLIALNSTIEAARAGKVSRGFDGAAAKVKYLHRQTSRATDETGGFVTDILGETAVSAVPQETRESAVEVSSAVSELSKQSESLQTVAHGYLIAVRRVVLVNTVI